MTHSSLYPGKLLLSEERIKLARSEDASQPGVPRGVGMRQVAENGGGGGGGGGAGRGNVLGRLAGLRVTELNVGCLAFVALGVLHQ
ncbi:hypothetical protein E2C01_018502 [Portunus trituberculatus]|uniref:Uncharacterized protein n=1 Tax=Portunus trituberculatus TaxID=210409 RepID=A0A5B7DUN6_PORTR|nr:hypothetical protein [Portunus trituberculatus]